MHKGKTVTTENTENTGNTEATTTSTSQGNGNTSSNNQTTGNQNGVKTGDSFPIGICIVLMLMSGCSMFIVYRELKKNR